MFFQAKELGLLCTGIESNVRQWVYETPQNCTYFEILRRVIFHTLSGH